MPLQQKGERMEFRPRCMATAVGSMPHEDAAKAVDVVLSLIHI